MRIGNCLLFALLAVLVVSSTAAQTEQSRLRGEIEGVVTDRTTNEPVPGATVYLVDRFAGAFTDDNGRFTISGLKPGVYAIRVSHVGFEPERIDSITVSGGQTASVDIALVEQTYSLKGITVTPGRFAVMGIQPTARQSLTRREIETAPQVGEDVYRAVSRLPGVAAEDFSSRFYVRGGEYEEIYATIDGLQVYEPFHLKEFKGGLLSAVDAAAVESIELTTGGFTAQYGDRASGIFNITTHRPPTERRKVAAAISFMNARVMTEGRFANNRGSWLASARRGYLDLMLQIAGEGENIKPTYYDVLGKVQYQLSATEILSAHVFHAGDRLTIVEEDEGDADTIITSYDNSYAWFNLHSQLHDRLTGHTVLSFGHVTHDRFGSDFWAYYQVPNERVEDIGSFTVIGLKSDWEYELSDKHLLKAGFDSRALSADYNYLSTDRVWINSADGGIELLRIDTIQTNIDPKGNQVGAYLSHRMRVAEPLTLELGGRFDRHSYTDDEHFSPRVNAALQIDELTTLRGGWGYFWQAQRIDELSPGDNLTEFYSAERAEHFTVGLERDMGYGIRMRLEAYHKTYTDLRPELRNTFDDLEAFPEAESDRQVVYRDGATSKGIELYFKRETGSKFTWWVSYSLAKVEDDIDRIRYVNILYPGGYDVYYNDIFPNPRDQRHTLYLDASYRPHVNWQFNMAWNYHTGWPYTGVFLASGINESGDEVYWLNQDELLAENYPAYNRLDLRVNRYFDVWGGRMTAFVELINVLGKRNVRNYYYEIIGAGGRVYLSQDAEEAFGTLPVVGVTFSLNM